MTSDQQTPSSSRPRGHDFQQRPLALTEARVLGTLMEKARTVPDSYPLTLNTLVTGCNQKSSREPVMNLADAAVLEALDALRALHLVLESSGSRVSRYEHNFMRAVAVPEQSAVLLGMLMLRGPQTAGELRLNTERWYKFLDIASVDAFLEELQERSEDKGGALVVKLPRAPGAREQRWAHLLCGPVDASLLMQSPQNNASAATEDELIHLTRRVTTLENTVAALQDQLQNLNEQLGLSQPGQR
ncbi:YceH family protein [Hydrogenophaga sp.]|uniref:YceH family protein n=1 Tax=Hydrogenophaga sp. TaxID=1904254 RepID=UPI003AF6086D